MSGSFLDGYPKLFYSRSGGWCSQEFSRRTMPVRWNLLRMEPVPKSNNRNWKEQVAHLDTTEEPPSAALLAFAAVLHFDQTGKRLFENCWIRTSNVTAAGDRVVLNWNDGRLLVDSLWDGNRRDVLWVVSARFPSLAV